MRRCLAFAGGDARNGSKNGGICAQPPGGAVSLEI
jgi:hypothetical protein